ncbi:transcript variant X1 [Nothobranchius furzeri]|uniref:Transmembrane protein 81 n=2 Tax=Nothobranchius furzeri TaxID=105023 RepID=A0A8C6M7B6_NOTFU|nr:transcript variant X1 [Nothobranchius furzeri]
MPLTYGSPSNIKMHICSVRIYAPLLLLCLISADLKDVGEGPVEVITESSACSTTCGIGVKTQTLCLLTDGATAVEENRSTEPKVSGECRVRKAACLDSWQCGLRTMTVTSGQKVEIDCLEEVMEAMGKFSWRVSWRYARGIISSDDSLFDRWNAPHLDRVVLEPVQESDAGTYRCDVQDTTFRRVKRIYWGIRVLPEGVMHLDYDSSVAQWEPADSQQNLDGFHQNTGRILLYAAAFGLILSAIWIGLLGLCRKTQRIFNRHSNHLFY